MSSGVRDPRAAATQGHPERQSPPVAVAGTSEMPGFIERLAAAFRAEGKPAWIVGGAVRDRLLGAGQTGGEAERPRDIDLWSEAPAEPIMRELPGLLDATLAVLDAARGHFRLVPRVPARGDPQWVDLSAGQDLGADLGRRDFTVNAMAVPLEAWICPDYGRSLVDPFGGRADLDARRLRAVGPRSIADDPVRMVRAVRFSLQFGLTMEADTRSAIRSDAGRIREVSAERVRDELFALFALPVAAEGIDELDALELLDVILPELAAAKGVVQPREHRWDVFRHSVETVRAAGRLLDVATRRSDPVLSRVPWRDELNAHFAEIVSDGQTRATLLKAAALLHDLGKPESRTVEPSGRIRFMGHQETGAVLAAKALRRLRCSRKTVMHVEAMIRHHLRPGQISHRRETPSDRALFRYYRDLGGVALDTLYLNAVDYLAATGPVPGYAEWAEYTGMIGDILCRGFETRCESKPFLLLNGHEVMREFSLDPGPKIGALLSALREAEAEGRVRSQEEAVEFLRRLQDGGKHSRAGDAGC